MKIPQDKRGLSFDWLCTFCWRAGIHTKTIPVDFRIYHILLLGSGGGASAARVYNLAVKFGVWRTSEVVGGRDTLLLLDITLFFFLIWFIGPANFGAGPVCNCFVLR